MKLDSTTNLNSLKLVQILKMLWSEGWPFALSRILSIGGNFLIAALLSIYGLRYFAASSLITSGQVITLFSVMSILYSTGIYVGKKKGTGEDNKIGCVLQSSIICALILSPIVILPAYFSKIIYTKLGQDPALAEIAQEYFRAYVWGVPGFLVINAWQQFFIGIGYAKLVLVSTLINLILFGIIGYLVVYANSYSPYYGIVGMGYSFIIANYVTLMFILVYAYKNKDFKKYQLFIINKLQLIIKDLLALLRTGIPIGLQIFTELFAIMMITIFAGWLGTTSLAASQITEQFLGFFIAISIGISQTTAVLISRYNTNKAYRNWIVLAKWSLIIGFILSLIAMLLIAFLGKHMISLFIQIKASNDTEITFVIARSLFVISGIAQVADYMRNISSGILRGHFITLKTMYLNILSMSLIGLFLGYLLGFKYHFGIEGVYLGRSLGMTLGAICNLILCLNLYRHMYDLRWKTWNNRINKSLEPISRI